jgi:predicted HTH domain antitoxin
MTSIKEIKLKVPRIVSEKEARIILSTQLYNEGKITLKQAADIAELSVWDLLHELGKRGISFTNITPEDLKEELEELQ